MKRISPAMMAEAMGLPTQTIRVGLQQKAFDFGIALQQTSKKYTYIIYPEKAREIVGDEIFKRWEIEQ